MNYKDARKIHIVGIGGIGTSGLAFLLAQNGVRVTGSDLAPSLVTRGLARQGIRVSFGHAPERLPADAQLVIRSQAVPEDNPEIAAARTRQIEVVTYPEAVAALCAGLSLITVSGTHGKTTTTALIGHLLRQAGLDPTILVGSRVPQFDGNAVRGSGPHFVLEADEFARSFHAYHPTIAVVTNIDRDHLDTYHDLSDIIAAFALFYRNLRPHGTLIVNAEDRNVRASLRSYRGTLKTFGFSKGDLQVRHFTANEEGVQCTVHPDGVKLSLRLHGRHNVLNALAAYAVGTALRIPPGTMARALSTFSGSWRRFERVGTFHGIPIISDYGHHPTEIRATLEATHEAFPRRRVLLVFQPHHHLRLEKLFHEFAEALSEADRLIVTNVYAVAGREAAGDKAVTALDLLREIRHKRREAYFAATPAACLETIRRLVTPDDVLLIMGAGDIHELGHLLTRQPRR